MKFGNRVHCKSYLLKDSDGIYIEAWDGDTPVLTKTVDSAHIKAYARNRKGRIRQLDDWCGDGIEKTYRQKVECEFDGIYVGTVTLKFKGMIGTDWACEDYGYGQEREYGYFFKSTTEKVKCGIVYYQPNKKRYVPIEDISERAERKEE